jgi:hypothetical protein
MNRIIIFTVLVILIGAAVIVGWIFLGDQLQGQKGFGIYLSENDELVISDKDIMFYNWTSHHIKLNGEGIDGVKKLDLYHKSFVVKLNGKVMYNGSFWSDFDSMSYSGVAILDIITVQDGWTDTLRVEYSCVIPLSGSVQFCEGVDPRNNSEIFDYFQNIGKIVQ